MQEIQEMQVRSLGQEEPLEVEMAIHSSILAWKIQWTEESGGLQSKGSQRVGHDWTDLAAAAADVIKYYNLFSETWNKVVLNYSDLEYVSA